MSATLDHATMTAPDISCGHCVAAIEKAVGALPGVSAVKAHEQTKKVEVTFDPAKVSLKQIAATMDEEGYPVQES